MGTPVIVDAVRTPLGKRKGWLAGVHPAVLLGFAQARCSARRRRPRLGRAGGGRLRDPGRRAVQRHGPRAWLHAGLPQHTGATAVDAQCGSGQQPRTWSHDMVAAGTIDVGIACGVESMSRIPSAATSRPASATPGRTTGTSTCPTSSRRPTGSPAAAG